MGSIMVKRVRGYFASGQNGATTSVRGQAMEDLVCYVFSCLPGIEIVQRNALNAFKTEEVDVALWNRGFPTGVPFLPNVILVECKNWRNAVGSQEVAYFATRLRNRGCEYGVLIAANGITGIPELRDGHGAKPGTKNFGGDSSRTRRIDSFAPVGGIIQEKDLRPCGFRNKSCIKFWRHLARNAAGPLRPFSNITWLRKAEHL